VRFPLAPALLLPLLAACRPAPDAAAVWPFADSARVVQSPRGVVVSGSPLASEVGRDVLARGGNAVDAAVAVGFALQVVHPEAGNIGGGGFLMLRLADGAVHSLDYREVAPAAATPDMYLDVEGNPTGASLTGHLASGVPGSVAGLFEAHRRHGRLPWRELVEPAIRLARDGFVIDQYRHRAIAGDTARLSRFPASAAQYLPGGRPPEVGAVLQQPDLARTLETIATRGANGFYRGWVADRIVEEMARGGGLITHADLAAYEAKWRDPVRISYRGHRIYSMGPASSGGVTLALMFNMIEQVESLPAFGSAPLLHLEAEVMRRAFTDRNRWLGDPDHVEMPLDRLLSRAYARELFAGIDLARATPTPPFTEAPEPVQTTHYSIVDPDGQAVAVTTTINNSFGSAVTVTGAGFLLNDEMDDFTTAPGRPNMYGLVQGEANAIRPGKRMLSAMTPTIVEDGDGALLLLLGSPGGPTIISQLFQVISNVVDHGMPLPAALEAPRMHHQALPDTIRVEAGFAPAVLEVLRGMGHAVRERGRMGDVHAIIRAPGGWLGVSDPRRGGGGTGLE
jgi:gamma-glutamyltranspeptidase / glutathione hydrolase